MHMARTQQHEHGAAVPPHHGADLAAARFSSSTPSRGLWIGLWLGWPGIAFPFGNVVERRRFPTSALSAGAAAGAALRGGIIFPALRYDRIGHCSPGTPSSHPPTRLGELNSRCEPSGGITARVDWTASCGDAGDSGERERAHIIDSVAAVTSQPSTSLCLFPDPTAWDRPPGSPPPVLEEQPRNTHTRNRRALVCRFFLS